MATVNLGRIKSVWRGTWATGTAYSRDDVVQEGVNSYICTQAHTAGATFAGDSANWDLMAQGADLPTQSGQTGKFLSTDGTSLTWGEVSTDVLQTKLLYNSGSASSGGTVRNYYSDFHTTEGVVIGGTFTKLSSTSTILTGGLYCGVGGGGNTHGAGIWVAPNKQSSASLVHHTTIDPYRMSNPNGHNYCTFAINAAFTGLSSGTVGVWAAAGRGDGSSQSFIVNGNTQGNTGNSDQVNRNGNSSLWIMEVEL